MRITVNGEERNCSSEITLTDLVQQLGLEGKRLAIEVNGEIVPRSTHAAHALYDGDKIEIVHAIGGGQITTQDTH